MSINMDSVGFETEETVHEVDRVSIKWFALALGEKNPIYFDREAAKAAGFADVPAPPTFPTTFRDAQDAKLRDKVGFDFTKLVHGSQEYEAPKPLVAGDVLRIKSRVADIYTKEGKSGAMIMVKTESTGRRPDGSVAFVGRSTIIQRP
ncbi:MAG: MaoC family dehydratase N-terminal domain-containing protein [Deltaproteobacteria bacterium]|nr:MaoC family dehydratase N-terminal domain-containing protein [Deltaproteobacteria bacterium]